MPWENSAETHIWIFNVGRGNAAFVRTGLNHGFIIDMARSDEFSPAEFIKDTFSKKLTKYKDLRIAQAVLSHPHRDHIQECDFLKNGKPLHPMLLTCPHDREEGEEVNWDRITDDREGSAELLQTYRDLFKNRNPPLQTIQYESDRRLASALEYGLYYLRPPVCDELHEDDDNEYGNATSIMLYLRYGVNTILFPGDMTPEGMEQIMDDGEGVEKRFTIFEPKFIRDHPDWHEKTSDQPGLGTLLDEHGLSILVAPHHGLESCFSQKLYDYMEGGQPQLVVISEKRHTRPQDGEIHDGYRGNEGAAGLNVWKDGNREKLHSLSTVNGHNILVVFNGTGVPKVYAEKDPNDLLDIVD
jgi:beta-lactamase superfamily II metal-dependent hydrolase